SVSPAIKRLTNCTDDISRENTATALLWSTAALRATDKTNAVLPIAGRAAIITKSEGCQPEVILSNAVRPEGIPVNPSVLSRKDSKEEIASRMISSIFLESLLKLFWAISNRDFSA